MSANPGTLALVGGGEWRDGCTFDAGLLEASGGKRVVVVPTAAAYEHPERLVLQAAEWFAPLDAQVEGVMILARGDAMDPGTAEVLRSARFIYLAGSSPMHLRSVMKGSPAWDAIVEAWEAGAVVAGSSAAAMVLTDPMVDARGGGLTVGLGLIRGLAVVPHFGDTAEDAHGEKLHRSVLLAPHGVPVAGIPERTALIRSPEGAWSEAGADAVVVYLNGEEASEGLAALPAALAAV